MYVFDRDVHLYFWNIECTQRKLAVDEALRANVVINIVYIKTRLQSNLWQYNEPLYNEVLDMIERTIFFIPVIINLNIKKNFDITKPRYSWRANFAPPPPGLFVISRIPWIVRWKMRSCQSNCHYRCKIWSRKCMDYFRATLQPRPNPLISAKMGVFLFPAFDKEYRQVRSNFHQHSNFEVLAFLSFRFFSNSKQIVHRVPLQLTNSRTEQETTIPSIMNV